MDDDTLPGTPAGDSESRRGNPPLTRGFDADQQDDRDDIDLVGYWRVIVKRRWLVSSLLATVLVATAVLTLLATPIYRATAVMEIANEEQQIVQVDGVASQPAYDDQFQETQYELLRSRALAERVAAKLALDGDALRRLDRQSWLPGPTTKTVVTGAAQAPVEQGASSSLVAVTRMVQRGMTVEPVRNSRLVRVHFDSPAPEFSARVANALAQGFIQSGLERRFGASSYAKDYLEGQLKQVKARLEESERQLVAYAQKEALVSSVEGQSLAGRNLSDLNSALAEAQSQRIRAQARWNEARAASGAALPADMLATSIIRTLQEQRAVLQSQYQQKLGVFKPDYPEMRQLQGQIDEVDKQVRRELDNIRASVKAEYSAAASQERLLLAQLDRLRTDALEVDGRSIKYNILKREVDTNRELYDGLLQRYKQVGVAGDVRANNISIVDPAQVPEHRFKPNFSLNLAVGLLLGAFLGVLAAFLLEHLDDSLKIPDDIERELGIPVLGIIPKLQTHTPMEAFSDPRSAFSEAYRSVRTSLQFSTAQGMPKSLLITSSLSGEGKTTTALTLARNLAQLGKRVLLVDADLRNPSVHSLLKLRQDMGLSNFLAGAAGFDEVVKDSGDERLAVVLSGPLPPNPAELLSGDKLAALLEQASSQFDWVILDGPPIMGIADAPILASTAAATMLVVQSGNTRVGSARAAVKRLRFARAQLVGGLLTQFDAKVTGYGQDLEGYYAYGASYDPSKQ